MYIETNLDTIAKLATEKEPENEKFRELLRNLNENEIDNEVYTLNDLIAPQISCTDCGNCCKSLMVNINDEEANNLSNHLGMSRETFDNKYVEKGSNMMILNSIPCHFLADNKCTVYEYRFEGCKEFPALHLPHFTKRLFTTFMHYDRCPIIYNVVEELKNRLRFNVES